MYQKKHILCNFYAGIAKSHANLNKPVLKIINLFKFFRQQFNFIASLTVIIAVEYLG